MSIASWQDCRLHPDEAWAEIERLREEVAEHAVLITLQRKATLRADRLWQTAHGAPDTHFPGLHILINWMVAENTYLHERVTRLERILWCIDLALYQRGKMLTPIPDWWLIPIKTLAQIRRTISRGVLQPR